MPSVISATTTNGVAISPDNSGSLQLQTNNGTTAVTIDTSQNVGIGTSSPTSKLHVKDGAVNIENTSGYGVIEMGGSSGAFLDMKNPFSDDYDLRLQTDGSTAFLITAGSIPLTFQTNNTERMRIDSSGNVGIGSTTPSSTGLDTGSTKLFAVTPNSSFGAAITAIADSQGRTIRVANQGKNVIGVVDATDSQINYGSNSVHPVIFLSGGTERMRIDTSGNLRVGTTGDNDTRLAVYWTQGAPTWGTKYLANNSGSTSFIEFRVNMTGGGSTVGSITSNGSTTSYNTSSDYRLKENIAPMTGALAKVSALKPCTYTWKIDGSAGEGFIAHELQEVVPDAVTGEKDAVNEDGSINPQGIDTSFLVATLTAAIQEQQAQIEELKAKVSALEGAK